MGGVSASVCNGVWENREDAGTRAGAHVVDEAKSGNLEPVKYL